MAGKADKSNQQLIINNVEHPDSFGK
jgi:hypothetical protein